METQNFPYLYKWCAIQLKTANDRYLKITPQGQAMGCLADPWRDEFCQWLIVPASGYSNGYWLFNKGANQQSGEVLTLAPILAGKHFGQWKFFDSAQADIDKRHTFELRKRQDDYYSLICKLNDEAVSTRWEPMAAFTWKDEPTDDQQQVRFVPLMDIANLPKLEEGDGSPGSQDLEKLVIESSEKQPPEQTQRRLVGTAYVAFPDVRDDWNLGTRMRYSPYYLLKREYYWLRQYWYRYSGGPQRTQEVTVSEGRIQRNKSSTETYLQVNLGGSHTTTSKAPVPEVPGAEVGSSTGFKLDVTGSIKWITSLEEEQNKYTTHTVKLEFPQGKPMVVALWRLVDVFSLMRLEDGKLIEVASTSYIVPNMEHEASWPPEVTSQITKIAS